MEKKPLIPVTVLTGFLGAGKTTLLNHLLTQKHGYKCAIIINEFGAINIDHQLVVGADEEILELNNGCLCCRMRGDLIKSLGDLFQRQRRFDYVLVETTGLADPSPLAHTFRASKLADLTRLDGIVTVVDARHFEKEANDSPEALAQVAFADVILLNKTDLVSPADRERIERRLRKMNALAQIHRVQKAEIDVAKILNIKARELTAPFALPEHAAEERRDQHGEEHDHDRTEATENEAGGHHHEESVGSFYLCDERPLDLKKLEAWLAELVRTMGTNIYRSKGILQIKGQPKRVVFQGVQMMFDAAPDRFWNPGEKRLSQLVFIGKELDETKLRSGFESCIAP